MDKPLDDHEIRAEQRRDPTLSRANITRLKRMKSFLLICLLVSSSGFPVNNSCRRTLRGQKRLGASSTADMTPQQTEEEALPGVPAMEDWLRSAPTATWNENIRHARFGSNLRGLRWIGPLPLQGLTKVVSIPSCKTIQTDSSSSDWDANLAVKLLAETQKGKNGQFYAYVQHLTESKSQQPLLVPTAPHALRHWTPEQRQPLAECPAGTRLLSLHEKQQQDWKLKCDKLGPGSSVSYADFSWAMEVVHSRAFRGQAIKQNAVVSLLAPILAAATGYIYLSGNPDPSLYVLGAMAAIAAAPIALKQDRQAVCLLPFIDSANHLEQADSQISYDPLTDSFQLSIGPNCVDAATKQLYISYGSRTDADLVLNHGFLPGLEQSTCDGYIDALASEYIRRNNI